MKAGLLLGCEAGAAVGWGGGATTGCSKGDRKTVCCPNAGGDCEGNAGSRLLTCLEAAVAAAACAAAAVRGLLPMLPKTVPLLE